MIRSFSVRKQRAVRLCLPFVVGLCGCHAAPATPPLGTLVLGVSPVTATVFLDEQPLLLRQTGGQPARVRMPAGPHRLEVRAVGYLTRFYDLAVRASADSVLSVSLHPDPEADLDTQSAATTPFAPRPLPIPP